MLIPRVTELTRAGSPFVTLSALQAPAKGGVNLPASTHTGAARDRRG